MFRCENGLRSFDGRSLGANDLRMARLSRLLIDVGRSMQHLSLKLLLGCAVGIAAIAILHAL